MRILTSCVLPNTREIRNIPECNGHPIVYGTSQFADESHLTYHSPINGSDEERLGFCRRVTLNLLMSIETCFRTQNGVNHGDYDTSSDQGRMEIGSTPEREISQTIPNTPVHVSIENRLRRYVGLKEKSLRAETATVLALGAAGLGAFAAGAQPVGLALMLILGCVVVLWTAFNCWIDLETERIISSISNRH